MVNFRIFNKIDGSNLHVSSKDEILTRRLKKADIDARKLVQVTMMDGGWRFAFVINNNCLNVCSEIETIKTRGYLAQVLKANYYRVYHNIALAAV